MRRFDMSSKTFSMPELITLVGTRVVLGVGIGLLVGGRLDRGVRIGAGCALATTVGALTTIPFVMKVLARGDTPRPNGPGRMKEGLAGAQVP